MCVTDLYVTMFCVTEYVAIVCWTEVCVCVTQFPTELCDNVMPDRAACACVCVTMLYVAVCVCA